MDTNILDTIDMRELGKELQQARIKRGLTQEEAAKIIEVARTTITAIPPRLSGEFPQSATGDTTKDRNGFLWNSVDGDLVRRSIARGFRRNRSSFSPCTFRRRHLGQDLAARFGLPKDSAHISRSALAR